MRYNKNFFSWVKYIGHMQWYLAITVVGSSPVEVRKIEQSCNLLSGQ
jgi:hypothetical protein